jgi:hypothetical protein
MLGKLQVHFSSFDQFTFEVFLTFILKKNFEKNFGKSFEENGARI